MTKKQPGWWGRNKFWLSGAVLLAPIWYLYQALNPVFPPAWEMQRLGDFTATPAPVDQRPAYRHGDGFMKDFSVQLCEGCWERVRTAHFSLGRTPQPMNAELDGVLHGGRLLQHAHAPFAEVPSADDRLLWLTIEDWQGRVVHAAWTLDGRAIRSVAHR